MAGHSILLLNHHWLAEELRALGHSVVSLALGNPGCDIDLNTPEIEFEDLLKKLPDGFIPSRIVYYDDSGVPWIRGLEDTQIPKLFYSVDTFHHHHWHTHFSAMFDAVLVAQKDYMGNFSAVHKNVSWFPLWAARHLEPSPSKKYNCSFVGTLNRRLNERRVDFFEKLQALVPVEVKSGDYGDVYPYSKIVINQTVHSDLNFRVFEALMSGALLLTPEIHNGMRDLFEPGTDLVIYREDDAVDAARQIEYYLSHEEERTRIAAKGRAKLLANHLPKNRAETLIDHIVRLRHAPSRTHYSGTAVAYLASYFVCCHEKLNWGSLILLAGANALIKSAQRQEGTDGDYGPTLALYKHQFESRGEHATAEQLLESIRQAYPTNKLFILLHIQLLKNANKRDKALSLCRELSSQPEQILNQVDQLLAGELSK